MKVTFKNSQFENLLFLALKEYYELVNKKELKVYNLEDVLELYKNEDVYLVSKWLMLDGFSTYEKIKDIVVYFDDEKEYTMYCNRRMSILLMDIEDDSVDSLFSSITELFDSVLYFLEDVSSRT